MKKLKPCPFCGGNARLMHMGYPPWVYCEKCGAKVHGGVIGEKDGEKASVEAWNRRIAEDVKEYGQIIDVEDFRNAFSATSTEIVYSLISLGVLKITTEKIPDTPTHYRYTWKLKGVKADD